MNNYYSRQETINTDGSPLFAIGYDKENESEIVKIISSTWNCEIYPFGRLSPIDFYAIRDGRLVGVLELKSRTHDSKKYLTVFLNVRKWLALKLASIGLGCPAIFIVKFTDQVKYIDVEDIDTSKITIGGTKEIVKSKNDIEPIIEVSISQMKTIKIIDQKI